MHLDSYFPADVKGSGRRWSTGNCLGRSPSKRRATEISIHRGARTDAESRSRGPKDAVVVV